MSDEMNERRLGPARLLAQAIAAAVLLAMVGALFYVSPLGPGGASGRATPTPHATDSSHGSPTPHATDSSHGSPTPVANPPLSISNGTTLHVTLVVNGAPVGTFPPGAYADPIKNLQLPGLPWSVEARTDSGRVLVSFTVKPGSVWATAYPGLAETHGDGARADLSCGRLDVWSGPPLGGPMPPSTFPPHDCDP